MEGVAEVGPGSSSLRFPGGKGGLRGTAAVSRPDTLDRFLFQRIS